MLITCRSVSLKAKWIAFIARFASDVSGRRKRQRAAQCNDEADQKRTLDYHKPVPPCTESAAAATAATTLSTAEDKSLVSIIFRRRGSNASELSNAEMQNEVEQLQRLYLFAVDELNFAQDSRGSLYYEGDRITAHEAIDDCTSAFMQLLQRISDMDMRRQLRRTMVPKLITLQEQYNELPPPSPPSPT